MKRKRKRKPIYVAEPQYVFDELPGYMQKRYLYGQGFIDVRPDMTRQHYPYNVQPVFGHTPTYDSYGKAWIDREEDGLFIPLSNYEIRYMRRMAARQAMSEWEQAQLLEDAEKEERRKQLKELARKKRENRYLWNYLHNTGLWYEALKAGCHLGWLFNKNAGKIEL